MGRERGEREKEKRKEDGAKVEVAIKRERGKVRVNRKIGNKKREEKGRKGERVEADIEEDGERMNSYSVQSREQYEA